MQSNHRVSRLDLKEHGISIATLPEVFYNTNRRLSLVTQVILATLGKAGMQRRQRFNVSTKSRRQVIVCCIAGFQESVGIFKLNYSLNITYALANRVSPPEGGLVKTLKLVSPGGCRS